MSGYSRPLLSPCWCRVLCKKEGNISLRWQYRFIATQTHYNVDLSDLRDNLRSRMLSRRWKLPVAGLSMLGRKDDGHIAADDWQWVAAVCLMRFGRHVVVVERHWRRRRRLRDWRRRWRRHRTPDRRRLRERRRLGRSSSRWRRRLRLRPVLTKRPSGPRRLLRLRLTDDRRRLRRDFSSIYNDDRPRVLPRTPPDHNQQSGGV